MSLLPIYKRNTEEKIWMSINAHTRRHLILQKCIHRKIYNLETRSWKRQIYSLNLFHFIAQSLTSVNQTDKILHFYSLMLYSTYLYTMAVSMLCWKRFQFLVKPISLLKVYFVYKQSVELRVLLKEITSDDYLYKFSFSQNIFHSTQSRNKAKMSYQNVSLVFCTLWTVSMI